MYTASKLKMNIKTHSNKIITMHMVTVLKKFISKRRERIKYGNKLKYCL